MPCTTILVGKNASYDGSTIISRNDDGGFDTKKTVIVKENPNKQKYKCVISHLEIELEPNAMRYSATPSVDLKNGIWAACGINQANVAMTATETISSNPRVLGADPYVYYKKEEVDGKTVETAGGIGEEDLVCLVLPFIHSAKEGVLRVANLLEQYGTYEPNGMAFSDENDIWWLETIGGHHWIARRVKDDEVVIMPNQFGLDQFDFDDAYGEQKNNLCSKDLKDFMESNHLYLGLTGAFNPRLAFGSRTDQDHIYNTPRAWYLLRYFCPNRYGFNTNNPLYQPESDDIPWSFIPQNKVTIQDIKYCLASYYQGTVYNPYGKDTKAGKYRSIGVPNTDTCGILQIRGYQKDAIKGIEWLSLGGGAFTACIPLYTNVDSFPKYISETTLDTSTNYFYWTSRLISALVDAHYASSVVFDERYQKIVFNKAHEILYKTDQQFQQTQDINLLAEANQKIVDMLEKESTQVLNKVLNDASNHMKTSFNRSDY